MLGSFLSPVFAPVSLFSVFPPTIILGPFGQSHPCTGEVMPDTFWSLDKILDARVVPMESALGYAPGRG